MCLLPRDPRSAINWAVDAHDERPNMEWVLVGCGGQLGTCRRVIGSLGHRNGKLLMFDERTVCRASLKETG